MIIRQLELDSFGKFCGTQIELQPGINVIYGGNESGKTTVCTFVKRMIATLPGVMDTEGAMDDRYQPQSSEYYEGRIVFENHGKSYSLYRDFRKGGKICLTDLTNDREIALDRGEMDVRPALAYLENEHKKLSDEMKAVQAEESAQAECGVADDFKRCQSEREQLQVQREQLTRDKAVLMQKIKMLEAKTDSEIQADRQERMKAIQLIQENNEVAALYKKKKAKLREMEAMSQEQQSDKKIQSIINTYEEQQAQIEAIQETYATFDDNNEGNGMRNLAIIFPFVALTVLIWIGGEIFGLSGLYKIAAAVGMAVMTVLVAFVLMQVSGHSRRRKQKLLDKVEMLEEKQEKLLAQYGVDTIEELYDRQKDTSDSQADLLRLRQEMSELRERYEKLQAPLKPYLEKYGDSLTLESSVGQEEKHKIEQLRRQLTGINRSMDRVEVQIAAVESEQEHLHEMAIQQQKKLAAVTAREEDRMAIDISMGVIRELANEQKASLDYEPVPVLMDDSFALYDDIRLQQTLSKIAAQSEKQQSIIFTCHHREGQMLEQSGYPFTLIELA